MFWLLFFCFVQNNFGLSKKYFGNKNKFCWSNDFTSPYQMKNSKINGWDIFFHSSLGLNSLPRSCVLWEKLWSRKDLWIWGGRPRINSQDQFILTEKGQYFFYKTVINLFLVCFSSACLCWLTSKQEKSWYLTLTTRLL